MKRILFALVAFLFVSSSWAAFPPVSSYTASNLCGHNYTFPPDSMNDAAKWAWAASNTGCDGSNVSVSGLSQQSELVYSFTGSVPGYSSSGLLYLTAGSAACPAHSTGTSSCTCDAGYAQSGSSCVADPLSGLPDKVQITGSSTSICVGGLKVQGKAYAPAYNDSTKGFVYGPWENTGVACTPGTGGTASSYAPVTAPTTASPSTCSGYWGQVNGVDTCVPKMTSVGSSGTVNSSSSSTSTTGGTTTGSASTGSTSCDGTNCTTTTTTTPDGGGTPTTTTTVQPQDSFCSANPASPLCKSAQSECEKNPNAIGCSEFGTPDNPSLTKETSTFSSISSVVFGSVSGCPSDLTFSVFGHTYAISYASMCSSAQTYVAPVVLVLSLFAAAFIFSGGFRL